MAVTVGMGAALHGYVWLGGGDAEVLEAKTFLLTVMWGAILTSCVPNLILGPIAFSPIARLHKQIAAGKTAEELDPADVRRALTFHQSLAAVVFAEWVIGALAYWPITEAWGPPRAREALVATVGAGITLGFLVAVLVVYGMGYVIARRVAPVVLSHGTLEHLQPLRTSKTFHHIGLLVLTLGVVQPAAVLLLLSVGVTDTFHLVYLFILMLGVGAFQAAGVLFAISRPAGHLAGRMADVRKGYLDTVARVEAADTFGQLASDFNAMVDGLRQREVLRETFGRYVSQQVADEILGGRVELGGELRTATVLFSDIRGFTKMSEKLSPEEVVRFLNRYLDIMVDCVFEHGGVLDKFIGDAIMAVFGAPVSRGSVEADAMAAMSCAVEMSERLDTLNEERVSGGEEPLEIGIGLHTGALIAGNIGSSKFMEYTVIGDTVNLSSRIEGMTKHLQKRILVSDATAKHANGAFHLDEMDTMEVRGRDAPVKVFAVTSIRR